MVQARGELEGALVEVERALAMSPNLAVAHWQRGATLIFSGRPQEGLAALETCIRLDPRDPFMAVRLLHMACGLYFAREYECVIEAAKRLIRSYPDFPMIYRWPAAALGQLGRAAEAKEWLEKAVSYAPAAFNMYVHNRVPWFRPMVSAGGPCPLARGPAQGRMGRLTQPGTRGPNPRFMPAFEHFPLRPGPTA
jgi:adenylate cyclase